MKRSILFAILSVLLVSMSFSSCESKSKQKELSVSGSAEVRKGFDLLIDIEAFNAGAGREESLAGRAERILHESVLPIKLQEFVDESGLSSSAVSQFLIKDKVMIKNKVAGSFDLSIFEGVKLYAGSDYKLIATITSLSSDELSLKIEMNNLLPLLQSTGLPIRLTTTTDKNIEGVNMLAVVLHFTFFIEVE
ncbi:hypothetical protein [Porphyromonas gulae]|nr:hypothetical protein [Porphyromonas gulae]